MNGNAEKGIGAIEQSATIQYLYALRGLGYQGVRKRGAVTMFNFFHIISILQISSTVS